jgi:hypothetical protein
MLENEKTEKGQVIQLCDVHKKFDFDEPEIPAEIKLIPISSGVPLDQLGQVIYEPMHKKASGYNVLNMRCYNNVNRARYAFLN